MDTAKEYYKILTDIWKTYKKHLPEIEQVIDYDSPTWKTICDDFDAIEASAPEHMKRYAGEMVLLHVDELERRWRK